MDFLTHPLLPPSSSHPAPPSPSPSSPSSPSSPLTEASSSILERQPSASSSHSTPHSEHHQIHVSRFSALRTAALPQHEGVEGEKGVKWPDTKKGDWRAFGRVRAYVVLKREREGGQQGSSDGNSDEEEWAVEGVLWMTTENRILLNLDRSFPPLRIARSTRWTTPTPLPLMRRLSRTISTDSATADTKHENRRRRFSSSSTSSSSGSGPAQGSKGVVKGYLKKVMATMLPNQSAHEEESKRGGNGLSRTSTREEKLGGRRSSSVQRAIIRTPGDGDEAVSSGEVRGETSVRFEENEPREADEPSREQQGVFPEYKNHPITALHISSVSSITALRFFPQTSLTSTSSSAPEPTTSAWQPDLDPSSDEPTQRLEVKPPVVELDITADGFTADQARGETNLNRSCTVGFVFKEILLADSTRHHGMQRSNDFPFSPPPSRNRYPIPLDSDFYFCSRASRALDVDLKLWRGAEKDYLGWICKVDGEGGRRKGDVEVQV
ncbi:hypothetical protein JCM11641_002447 [Rhodosporidiobolus odoratus]